MRKSSLALLAAAIGLAASQASAADLPRKAPAYIPPAPPPITWTGCYIGGNIGGAFGDTKATYPISLAKSLQTVPALPVAVRSAAIISSPAGGCSASAICTMGRATKEVEQSPARSTGPVVANFNNQWFDTLTGRLGYAVAPTWLIYCQGGAAWGHTSTNLTFDGVQIGQTSKTRTGWTAGGGVEWMFAPHWSAFLEGNYMDFGSQDGTFNSVTTGCAVCTFNVKATEATVLVGVNYRFGWGKAPY